MVVAIQISGCWFKSCDGHVLILLLKMFDHYFNYTLDPSSLYYYTLHYYNYTLHRLGYKYNLLLQDVIYVMQCQIMAVASYQVVSLDSFTFHQPH
jgi:hypothetical protein